MPNDILLIHQMGQWVSRLGIQLPVSLWMQHERCFHATHDEKVFNDVNEWRAVWYLSYGEREALVATLFYTIQRSSSFSSKKIFADCTTFWLLKLRSIGWIRFLGKKLVPTCLLMIHRMSAAIANDKIDVIFVEIVGNLFEDTGWPLECDRVAIPILLAIGSNLIEQRWMKNNWSEWYKRFTFSLRTLKTIYCHMIEKESLLDVTLCSSVCLFLSSLIIRRNQRKAKQLNWSDLSWKEFEKKRMSRRNRFLLRKSFNIQFEWNWCEGWEAHGHVPYGWLKWICSK